MFRHRFGRKLKLPSTAAIKHQLLLLMLEDEIRAIPGVIQGRQLCNTREIASAEERLDTCRAGLIA